MVLNPTRTLGICEILNIFHTRQKEKVTISRTNLPQQGRNLQNLMVTAPGEAEDNVARAKLCGIKKVVKTVLPTGDEFWRFIPGEFPTRAMIRITNLPVLLDTDELEELLKLPEETDLKDNLERETILTDASTVYTGRARISIFINSKKHEEELFNWSMWRNSVDGQMVWNEIPIYTSNPRLHDCSKCEAESSHQFKIGHDDQWFEILRKTTDSI